MASASGASATAFGAVFFAAGLAVDLAAGGGVAGAAGAVAGSFLPGRRRRMPSAASPLVPA